MKGYRWVVGDVNSIKVFEDVLIGGKSNFRVEDTYNNRDGVDLVSDLLIPCEKKWDNQKVVNLFQSCEAKAILGENLIFVWEVPITT